MKSTSISNLFISACLLILSSFGICQVSGQTGIKQGPSVPVNFCLNAYEMDLYLMINEYRQTYNLAPIPLSKSLSYIATLHAKDLYFNHPDQGSCNFHSWSGKGKWAPFCYPRDENKKNSVWDKARELTKYPSKAYEIVYWENNPLVKDTIIMVWKVEEYFSNFLLNSGKWSGKTWNAIGIAVYENYACAWFGEVSDPEGEAYICGSKPPRHTSDTLKPTVKPNVPVPVLPLPKPPIDSISGTYYIIIKTNLSADAANKLVSTLKGTEYPLARMLEKDGKVRVSAFESTDKPAVMTKLKEVKKVYKDAWLLKR